jgi:hypothetical protein
VFGGYWFYPLMSYCGRKTWDITCYTTGVANKCAIAIGNSVVWPVLVITYEKSCEIAIVLYDAFGRPVVNILYNKYKVAEDCAFIYVFGPTVKTILDHVPEKNPFCSESDSELDEFLPGPVGDANEVAEEEIIQMNVTDELPEEIQIHDEDLDDLGWCIS